MNWNKILDSFVNGCIDVAWRLLGAIVVLAVGALIIKLVMRLFPKGSAKRPMDKTVHHFLKNAVRIALYIVLLITVVGVLGVPLASVIAVLGSAGVAIALALQGSLSNVASGVLLLVCRPLAIGDFVEIGSASGTVTDLGLVYTKLRTGDNREISIPNSSVANSTVINYSREKTRRVDLLFGVDYNTDVEATKSLILDVINRHELVLGDPEPYVRLTELADSSLNITVRVWCESGDYFAVKTDLTEGIKAAFDENNISIPYPQMDVHIKQG